MTWETLKPQIPADMLTFSTYFENTWIGTTSSNPLFTHDIWNQYDATRALLPRSSNIAEGFHHGFHSMLGCSHPTIWKFLDTIKAEQSLTDVKLAKRLCREGPAPRQKKWVKYDQKLQTIVEDYDNFDSVLEYLDVVGTLL